MRFSSDRFSQNRVGGGGGWLCAEYQANICPILGSEMPGFDLCVLASCDHSVQTFGTFGMWGSLLAGGEVIAPTGTGGTDGEETEVILFIYS